MYGMKLLIHSQTSTVQPLKFGMDKQFHPTLYNGCNYLSMLGIKLNHASERGPWERDSFISVVTNIGKNTKELKPRK